MWKGVYQIDFENSMIYISKTRVYAGTKVVEKGAKTKASNRAMPMPEAVKEYLQTVLEKNRKTRIEYGTLYVDSG